MATVSWQGISTPKLCSLLFAVFFGLMMLLNSMKWFKVVAGLPNGTCMLLFVQFHAISEVMLLFAFVCVLKYGLGATLYCLHKSLNLLIVPP